MSSIQIPYQFLNGVELQDCGCGTEYLTIDTTNFPLCQQKYFTLRLVSISNGVNTFSYNGNLYGNNTLTASQLITLINTAFQCPNSYGCLGQVAKFKYTLTALTADKWTSQNIVNNVSVTSLIYSFGAITINGVPYPPIPHVFWNDTINGNASSQTFDYVQAIIDYIESLNIPEYVGAINNGSNGMSDNYDGDGLLELYFEVGTTVVITITEPTQPIAGTFTGGVLTTTALTLLMENTSDLSSGDVLTTTNYQVSDGNNQVMKSTTPDATIIPYNIFCDGCGLNENNGFIMDLVIVTEQGCARNNLATGIITAVDILDCINNQTTKTGTNL
jgi:hypothetical protein